MKRREKRKNASKLFSHGKKEEESKQNKNSFAHAIDETIFSIRRQWMKRFLIDSFHTKQNDRVTKNPKKTTGNGNL